MILSSELFTPTDSAREGAEVREKGGIRELYQHP